MNINIESGIPLPAARNASRPGYVAAFRQMKPGDSFVVPDMKTANAARTAGVASGVKVATRAQPDGSVRIWRLE